MVPRVKRVLQEDVREHLNEILGQRLSKDEHTVVPEVGLFWHRYYREWESVYLKLDWSWEGKTILEGEFVQEWFRYYTQKVFDPVRVSWEWGRVCQDVLKKHFSWSL